MKMRLAMTDLMVSFFKDRRAATAIEYAILAASVSLVIIAVVQQIGAKLSGVFTSVALALR